MGHYDDCYEADARDEYKKEKKESKKELIELIGGLSHEQRLAIIKCIKEIDTIIELIAFVKRIK